MPEIDRLKGVCLPVLAGIAWLAAVGAAVLLLTATPASAQEEQPQPQTRPQGGGSDPDPLDDAESETLKRIVGDLQRQAADLQNDLRRMTLDRTGELNRALAAEEKLVHAENVKGIREEQYLKLTIDLQQSITIGFGGYGGSTIGDPLFGSFAVGPERLAAVGGGSLDAFGHGLIDGLRLWFEFVEQPGIGPRGNGQAVLLASFGMETYLRLRPTGWYTALVVGYRHHHFPLAFNPSGTNAITDAGEIVISWGRRVPMTREREARSFWQYSFRPIIEWFTRRIVAPPAPISASASAFLI